MRIHHVLLCHVNQASTLEDARIHSQLFAPFQILASLRNIRFNNSAGEEVSFTENHKRYDILNWIFFPNGSFLPVNIGGVHSRAPPGLDFTIHPEAIVWATEVGPKWKLQGKGQPRGAHHDPR